jgi:hypothetical protein
MCVLFLSLSEVKYFHTCDHWIVAYRLRIVFELLKLFPIACVSHLTFPLCLTFCSDWLAEFQPLPIM